MRLFEYQAKKIFKEKGIPVPEAYLARSKADIPSKFLPSVFKAQVLSGGRGKAGGIIVVSDASGLGETFEKLMEMKFKGERPAAILIEEMIPIVNEFFLSLIIDKQKRCPVFIASAQGGVEIEKTARESPDAVMREEINCLLGLQNFQIRRIGKFLGIADLKTLGAILHAMYAIFVEKDATLVEINPLAETPNGFVALDAKMILDDQSIFRHETLFAELRKEQIENQLLGLSPDEKMARNWEITYVKLDGDIGIISDGAGTGMLTLDLVMDEGGRAANFCELGGLGDADRMKKGLHVVTTNPKVKVVLISLIGGITRMDDMASGVVDFLNEYKVTLPIVVRMCGTREEEGRRILDGKKVFVDHDLGVVVTKAVEIARNLAS